MRTTLFRAAALSIAATAFLLPATAAHAHGDTLEVVVTGHDFGHVRTTITWENDGDPVDERVAATVNAVSGDGSTALGPFALVRDPGTRAGWTTREALPPGIWKVTVETGHPALGRGEKVITVSPGTPASPVPVTPGATSRKDPRSPSAGPAASAAAPSTARPATPSAPAGRAGGAERGSGVSATAWAAAGGTLLALACGAGIALRARRRRAG
jgi:hypothetical protein